MKHNIPQRDIIASDYGGDPAPSKTVLLNMIQELRKDLRDVRTELNELKAWKKRSDNALS